LDYGEGREGDGRTGLGGKGTRMGKGYPTSENPGYDPGPVDRTVETN